MNDSQCNPEVYKHGKAVCLINSIESEDIETWVRKLAKKTKQKMDWAWVGGRAVVRTLGDVPEAQKVVEAMKFEINELGRKQWEPQGSDFGSYNYIQILYPDTPEEIAKKEKQWKDHCNWCERQLKDTEYVMEANHFEMFSLWKEWHERLDWKEISKGMMETVATVNLDGKDHPVCLTGIWAKLNGHLVLFYSDTSLVVHHDKIKDWVREHTPNSKGCSDAWNFHNCLIRLDIDPAPDLRKQRT